MNLMRDVMVTFHVTFYASVGVYFHIFPINWNISSAFHLQMNTMNNFTEHVFIDFFHFVLVQPDSDKTLHCLLNGEEKKCFLKCSWRKTCEKLCWILALLVCFVYYKYVRFTSNPFSIYNTHILLLL